MAPHAPTRPSIALAAFAEKFIEGRRVIVFGNALSPFWEQLIERGARLVHVCDTDAARVAEAAARNTSQNVSFAPLGGAGLSVRDGAFDVGFIDNLATFTDPSATTHKLKRALSPRGVAIIAAPNPDNTQPLVGGAFESGQTLDYYSLYDLVHREFPVVRMAGQMPFVGYSVAELAPAEDPEPCLDAGFVPGGTEEPEWFVAVGSHVDVEFDPFLVVQLPFDTLLKNGSEQLLREQLRAARSAERHAVERLARLEAEHRRLAEVAERHQRDVDLARQVRLLQEELERKESWIMQLESRAATADARADEADQELDELRTQLGLSREPGDGGTDVGEPHEARTREPLPNLSELRAARDALSLELRAAVAEKATLLTRLTEAEQLASATNQQKLEAQAKITAEQTASLGKLAAENAALRAQLELAEPKRAAAERERDELAAKLEQLAKQLAEPAPELLADLSRLEAQLSERSTRIRQLETDLHRTTRFGASLARKLESHRLGTLSGAATGATANGALVSTEVWTAGPTIAEATSTELSPAVTSTWTEPPTPSNPPAAASAPETGSQSGSTDRLPGGAPTGTPELESELQLLRGKLDRLADRAAQQQADLSANQWQLEQIQAENDALRAELRGAQGHSTELQALRLRLQETEVLLAQLRWRQATASDDGPVR